LGIDQRAVSKEGLDYASIPILARYDQR
jgi:hypothetical protein